jgi:hypothetical protein
MYNGHGAAYFAVFLKTDLVTPVKEIYLHRMVVDRKSETLMQREVRERVNPFTKKIYQKSDGFRITDEISVINNNFVGDVGDYAILEGVAATQTEFYKAVELIKYANNSAYVIMYAEKNDARKSLSLPTKEVIIDCVGFTENGTITEIGSWTTTSVNEYISNLATITLRIRAVDLTNDPFLPSPPIPPTLLSPTDGADTTYTVTFEWEPVESYTGYDIQVAYSETQIADPDENFPTANMIHEETVTDTEITYTADADFDHFYLYWRVRVSPGGMWSDAWEILPFEFGNCIYLNHSDSPKDYLNIENFKASGDATGYWFTSLSKLQVGIRIKIPAGVTQATMIIANASNGATANACFTLTLTYQSGDGKYKAYFRVINGSGGTNSLTVTSELLNYDEWITLVCRWNSADYTGNDRIRMLVNDVDATDKSEVGTMPSTTSSVNNKSLQVGARYDLGSIYYLKAYLDQLIFNMVSLNVNTGVMTETQLENLHNAGAGRRYPHAYFKYDFNESSGNPADTGSGNKAITLTNTGGTYSAH